MKVDIFEIGRIFLMPKLFAISPTDTKVAYLESEMDLAAEERTAFKVKVLSVYEIGKIENLFQDLGEDDQLNGGQIGRLQEGLEMLVKGWENFKFENGQNVNYSEYKDKLHKIISIKMATELFGAALKANTLDEEDKGN